MPLVQLMFGDLFAEPLPQHPDSYFQRWVAGHQALFDDLDQEILAVIASTQVGNAAGTDLNNVGGIFGAIGKRRGRGDAAYENYLKTIVRAYEGNGTRGGLKFVVANIVLAPEDTIGVVEHFSDLEYTVRVSRWETHTVGSIWTLADISDPSAVEMRDLIYDCGDAAVKLSPAESTEVTDTHESPDAQMLLSPTEAAVDADADRGLGSETLDGDGEFE